MGFGTLNPEIPSQGSHSISMHDLFDPSTHDDSGAEGFH